MAPEATAADTAEMDEESSSDSDSDIESDEEQKDSEKVREKDSKVAEFLNMGLVYCTWLFVVSFKLGFNARCKWTTVSALEHWSDSCLLHNTF